MKQRLIARWDDLRARHWWLEHLVRAAKRYQGNNGDFYAAAITYYSFLALFPAILLAASIAGYVLQNNPHLLNELFDKVASGLPGSFGTTVHDAIQTAIDNRAGVGIVGILGLAYTGLGWVANLRAAVVAVWGHDKQKVPFVKAKLRDAVVLVGFGLGVLISIGLTTAGTALADQIADHLDVPGGSWFVKVVGILIPVLGDMIVFAWFLGRLARVEVERGILLRGALLASIGFEILKIIGSYYIARVTHSPAAGLFGSVIGILVWMDLVSRYVLFCAAWTATAPSPREADTATVVEVDLPADAPEVRAPGITPVGVAVSLLGLGFAAGAGAVGLLRRPASESSDRRAESSSDRRVA